MVINCLSPPSTNNFLKILISFLDTEQLMEAMENCLSFPRTVWNFWELFEASIIFLDFRQLFGTSKNFLTLPRTVSKFQNGLILMKTFWDFEELLKSSENCLRIARSAWNFREHLEISKNCLTLPASIWHISELFKSSEITIWDIRECCTKTLEEEWKWWKRIVALQDHHRFNYKSFIKNIKKTFKKVHNGL